MTSPAAKALLVVGAVTMLSTGVLSQTSSTGFCPTCYQTSSNFTEKYIQNVSVERFLLMNKKSNYTALTKINRQCKNQPLFEDTSYLIILNHANDNSLHEQMGRWSLEHKNMYRFVFMNFKIYNLLFLFLKS